MIVFLVGNTSWKRWKCHLRDSRFQNFLRGWGGVGWGGATIFYQQSQLTNHQYYCSFQEVRPVRISLRKGNFWQCQKVKLILLPGALPPVPRPGPRQPPNTSPVERLPAPIAVYFQNISTYFKSYWQPWFTEISSEVKWGKDTGRQLENPPYHICPSSDTQQLRSPWKFSRIHWSLCHLWLSFSSLQ